MQATPATWRLLLEAGWNGSRGLKVLCGGEAFPRPLAHQLLARVAEVWNMYGPTETTIWSTIQPIQPNEQVICIGRPIANTQAYVLDASLHLVPVGVIGELYLGGLGVARGYLHRPELTAERFLPDPFGPQAGARLYRTGDLARWLPDGRLECLGRRDSQVKLRGFRIELGEIEATVQLHLAVRECAVVLRPDPTGDSRLVAYLVPDGSAPLRSQDLRTFLQQSLPDYMVPATFMVLEQVPLTPNGKLDRRALLALDAPALEQGQASCPPSTPLEQALATLWQDLLHRPQVGLHDHFFALGGHSLLATQLIFRVSKEFGVKLPLQSLFEHPTLAEFAQAMLRQETRPGSLNRIAQLRLHVQHMSHHQRRSLLEVKKKEV